jgi:hypothetical protein
MSEAKPFASLSSGLLARKGTAKPAMRPQGFGSFGGSLEDLGWNDMGQAAELPPEHVPSSIEALTPLGGRPHGEPAPEQDVEPSPEPAFEPAAAPAVVEQQRALEESYPPEPAPVVSLPQRRAAPLAAKAKAAFTLRLDPDRHFKLRLACAVTRRSAQQLVTGALDEFLNTLPEVDALAESLPAQARRGRR